MKIILTICVLLMFVLDGFSEIHESATDETGKSVNEDGASFANSGSDGDRIYYGGYVTMNFSKNYSVIGAQPLIAYKLTPKLSLGTQVSYEYISDRRYAENQNGYNYGASIFSRLRLTPYFYGHTEFSVMSFNWFYNDGRDDRKIAPILFVGGGYSQPISANTWLNMQVLFDVLNHENSPYRNWEPYYSIGIGVGF